MNMQKCAVIGCGFVGSSIAFSLTESGLFSELILIDVNREKAEGEAMDLNHGVPFARPMKIRAGSWSDTEDCGLIIVTAGANQKPEETRIDLVHKNVKILRSVFSELGKVHCDGILLIVSNPVDILTYAAVRLSGFPPERVLGSGTVLDTARLKYLLGERFGVDSRSVHAFIIGEHGDSELAVWSSANISGVDLADFFQMAGADRREEQQRLYESVRDSAYEIISKKGATYYAIAMAVRRIAECIVRDEHSVLPVSTLLSGEYGLSDLCLGVPAIVDRGGVEQVLEIPLDLEERRRLRESADAIHKVLEELEMDF